MVLWPTTDRTDCHAYTPSAYTPSDCHAYTPSDCHAYTPSDCNT